MAPERFTLEQLCSLSIKELYEAKDRVQNLIKTDSTNYEVVCDHKMDLIQIEYIIELRELSMPVKVMQARSWWSKKDIDWFIANADFAFRRKSGMVYKENRIWIKTKLGYYWKEDSIHFAYPPQFPDIFVFNCFEFDIENGGLVLKCETGFNESINHEIIEKDRNAKRMLLNLLKSESPKLVNPPLWYRLFNFKSKYVKI